MLVRTSLLACAASATLLTACSTQPITLSSTSTALLPPSSGRVIATPHSATLGPAAAKPIIESSRCAVHFADVRDMRLDPNDLGMAGQRNVRTTDSVVWLSGALSTMRQDPRLRIVDDDKDAEFTMRVELVKAYIMTMTTQKSANVVLRAGFSRNGKDIDARIARGRDTGVNWANGTAEVQGALNRALTAAVSELDNAIVVRCRTWRIEGR